MIRWTDVRLLVLALSVGAVCSCASVPQFGAAGSHPASVPDAAAAIRLARLAWIKAHPEMREDIGSEAEWQAQEKAELEHGIWTVWDPVPANSVGGSLYVLLSQADGHVIRMYLTQ